MRQHSGVRLVVSAASAMLVLIGARPVVIAQQQAGTDQTPSFRSGVEVVSVDVNVIDRQGRPLRGLTAGDFTVTVAGKPRRVVTSEFIDHPDPVQEADRPRRHQARADQASAQAPAHR